MKELKRQLTEALLLADKIWTITPDTPGSMEAIQLTTSQAIRTLAGAIKELSRHIEPDLR